jgi:hypothetical protein
VSAARTRATVGLVLVAFVASTVLVPQVADGLAVVFLFVRDQIALPLAGFVQAVWGFLVDLAP